MLSEELLAAIAEYVKALIKAEKGVTIQYGTYVGPETVDPNLSKINMAGLTETQRGVRKMDDVSGLTPGDTVLLIGGNKTLIIMGKVAGSVIADL